MPARIATTGLMHGPELPKMLALIGRDEVLKRIAKTIKLLEDL